MKRARLIGVVMLLALPTVCSAQPATMGIYFDVTHDSTYCWPEPYTLFNAYIYLADAPYPVTAVEYRLADYHPSFIIAGVTYPDDASVYMGDPLSGHSIAYWPPLDGVTNEYLLLCTWECLSLEACYNDGGSIVDELLVIGPHPDSGELRGAYYPDNELFDIVGLTSIYCPYVPPDMYPPGLVATEVVTLTNVHGIFSEEVTPESAEDPAHYRVREMYTDPAVTIPVTGATLLEDNKTVSLTLDGPITVGIPYLLEAIYIEDLSGNLLDWWSWEYLGFAPDIAVLSPVQCEPSHVRRGCSQLEVMYDLTNGGTYPSGSFHVSVYVEELYGELAGGLLVDEYTCTGLDSGEVLHKYLAFALPPEIWGNDGRVRVVADDLEEILEFSEVGNERDRGFQFLAPRIISITDVPYDNGGMVEILFWKCWWDEVENHNNSFRVYDVFRRIDPPPGAGVLSGSGGDGPASQGGAMLPAGAGGTVPAREIAPGGAGGCGPVFGDDPSTEGWELVGSVLADGSDSYTVEVPTTADSSASGTNWSVYFVRALENPEWAPEDTTYYYTCIDSGYSVDNDSAVTVLVESFTARWRESSVEVTWKLREPALDPESEPAFFVYRADGESDPFYEVPSPEIERGERTYTYRDGGIEPGGTYRYRIECDDGGARRLLFETGAIEVPVPPLTLHQNRPNPFNPETEITYYLPGDAHTVLEVFDVSGRCVSRLVDTYQTHGLYRVTWRGTDGAGNQVASGVYFYRLRAGKEVRAMKMVLLR